MTPQEKLAARIKQATRLTWDQCAALTKLSNARFEAFAGIDASDETALARLDPVDAMQARLARWQARNFIGIPSSTQIVCGIVEELDEWQNAADAEDERDAVGDTLIYSAQLCTAHRLSLRAIFSPMKSIVKPIAGPVDASDALDAVGLLAHVALKNAQQIRGLGDRGLARHGIAAGVALLADTFEARGWDIADVFLTTATAVLRRDWIANPDGPVQA